MMENFLRDIVTNLVDNKDEVQITKTENEKSVVFEVRVGEGDMGRVIGRQGRTARAIRTIMKSLAIKEHKRATIEFLG